MEGSIFWQSTPCQLLDHRNKRLSISQWAFSRRIIHFLLWALKRQPPISKKCNIFIVLFVFIRPAIPQFTFIAVVEDYPCTEMKINCAENVVYKDRVMIQPFGRGRLYSLIICLELILQLQDLAWAGCCTSPSWLFFLARVGISSAI